MIEMFKQLQHNHNDVCSNHWIKCYLHLRSHSVFFVSYLETMLSNKSESFDEENDVKIQISI